MAHKSLEGCISRTSFSRVVEGLKHSQKIGKCIAIYFEIWYTEKKILLICMEFHDFNLFFKNVVRLYLSVLLLGVFKIAS